MRLYKLSNKLVVRFRHKACEFVKGFSSNDLEKPRSAFLDAHGRIVAVFDQKVLSPDEVLAVIEKQFLGRLKGHFSKYLFLSDTTLEETDFNVYFDIDGDYQPQEGELLIPQKIGRFVLTRRQPPSTVSDGDFTLFRLANDLPVQGIDFDQELLLNVGDEEYVSYSKGCYLGQEIIARVHYRSSPPKRLRVKPEEECSQEEKGRMTSKALDPRTGKRVGFVFTN